MKIYLHTIALEPARWTPQRVSQNLDVLIPAIAAAGFSEIEVFEPHLTSETVSEEIRDTFSRNGVKPVILSSYLNLNPAVTSDSQVDELASQVAERVAFYGFQKVRIFPGAGMNPGDAEGVRIVGERIQRLAGYLPETDILLETHDGSIADDPRTLVRLLEDIDRPKVGLLFQPTFFRDVNLIREQLQLEKPYIRHIHLQNRNPDLSFAEMASGIVLWPEILQEIGGGVESTLEFVPVGICDVASFDLAKTLDQIQSETAYVRTLRPDGIGS